VYLSYRSQVFWSCETKLPISVYLNDKRFDLDEGYSFHEIDSRADDFLGPRSLTFQVVDDRRLVLPPTTVRFSDRTELILQLPDLGEDTTATGVSEQLFFSPTDLPIIAIRGLGFMDLEFGRGNVKLRAFQGLSRVIAATRDYAVVRPQHLDFGENHVFGSQAIRVVGASFVVVDDELTVRIAGIKGLMERVFVTMKNLSNDIEIDGGDVQLIPVPVNLSAQVYQVHRDILAHPPATPVSLKHSSL